jgi:cytidylate kinase
MPVITISRQYGSGGQEIAQIICDRMGYRYFDKELMSHLGAQMGLAPDQVVDLPEDQHQVRSLVERLFGNAPTPFGDPGEWALAARIEAQQHMSIQTVQRLIRAAHDQGNVVIVGRGGQVVLRDAPDVFHVRVVAPTEVRIQRVQQSEEVTADVARERVLQHDQASDDYVRRFYDADLDDPLLYDMVINTGKLTPAVAVDLIIKALDALPAPARPKPADIAV